MKRFIPVLVLMFSVLLAACNFSLAEDVTPPPGYVSPTPAPTVSAAFPSVPPSVVRGQAIYMEKCLDCHGEKGLGNGSQAANVPVPVPAIGLRDIASQSNPASWFTVITRGNLERYMPSFTSLSESERWDVLAYVYSLSNTRSMVENGTDIYSRLCASCHGTDARGNPPKGATVNLADPTYNTQVTELGLYAAISKGTTPNMPPFKDTLSAEDTWSLVAYLRTLPFDMSLPVVQAPSATPSATSTLTVASATATNLTPEIATATAAEGTPLATSEITATGTAQTSPTGGASTTPGATFGSITGKVTNGSGGSLPSSLVITLHGFVNSDETVNLVTNLRPDGSYAFSDVPLESGIALIVSTEYAKTSYYSVMGNYDGSTTKFDLPITIYDTTTDASSISADRLHIFFDFSKTDLVQVIEIYIISNSSDKAVVAAEGQPILTYTLPVGASNLQFETGSIGSPYLSADNGFGDPTSILPGASSYQLMFAFDLPYGKRLEVKQPLNVKVASVIVMAPDGLQVTGEQLTNQGTRDVQGTSYGMYSGQDLASGDILTFNLSGSPKSGTSASTTAATPSQTSLVIGLSLFGAVLILAGVFFFLRGRSRRTDHELLEEEWVDELGLSADQLMDAINSLDDQYKAGSLPEQAWRSRRAALKERLKTLIDPK